MNNFFYTGKNSPTMADYNNVRTPMQPCFAKGSAEFRGHIRYRFGAPNLYKTSIFATPHEADSPIRFGSRAPNR